MKQTIILGNIITMDEKRPFAKAYVLRSTSVSSVSQKLRRLRHPATRTHLQKRFDMPSGKPSSRSV